MKWALAGLGGLVAAAAVAVAVVVWAGDSVEGQQTDVRGQGDSEPVLAEDGATMIRSGDGLRFRLAVPTPAAGSYEYPTADQLAPWSTVELHPDVQPGGPDEPEVFTMWVVVFNHPERCTDEACDGDDFAEGAAAAGGIYQGDGRVADGDELELSASIRLGQPPLTGAPLEDPLGAEAHLLVASHGKVVTGTDHWIQLNSPLGNPSLWWGAFFSGEEL